MKSQFCKIENTIATDPRRALQYAKNGQAYCASLQRKYEEICDDGSVTPMEDPGDVELIQTDFVSESGVYDSNRVQDWEIVDKFKENKPGRMNWMACYEFGRQQGYFKEFYNHHSTKAQYYKAQKRGFSHADNASSNEPSTSKRRC